MTIDKKILDKLTVKAKEILSVVWQFCSYLFVPQWGRTQGQIDDM